MLLTISAEMEIEFTMALTSDKGKNQRRLTNLHDIEEESSVHVVIRQSIWEEVRFYQEVRSDKQLVSHGFKLKDVSAVKDFFEA